MALKNLSHQAHAAYQDLLSLMLDDAASDIRGTPVQKTINGRTYWYDHYRAGTQTHDKFLGEDTQELQQRLNRHLALKDQREARKADRARLVRLLRSERLITIDRTTGPILSGFEKSGVFRVGGVLVGTQAFRLYEGELGISLGGGPMVATDDIDVASFERLSLAIDDVTDPSLTDTLHDLKFDPVPGLDQKSVWKWRNNENQKLVEFLTPSFEAEEGIKHLPSLGVSAQALHHLNFLIADPIHVAGLYREGILLRVPRPERFAIHKLIVADRRREQSDRSKASKDRKQAELLITVLAQDRPFDLKEAFETALKSGPKWQQRLDATLSQLPSAASILRSL